LYGIASKEFIRNRMENEKTTKHFEGKKLKKMALGRGLDALLPGIESIDNRSNIYIMCDIELIRPNRFQPRLRFSEKELEALTESIKEQGIIQPILVRKDEQGYELIAGERRLKAAKRVGLTQIPAIVRDITDAELLEISIVENIQRENLNPMEEAEAYHRLMKEFGLTQEQVAVRVGKSRSSVANFLRLPSLPEEIKDSIMDGIISMGHARAILGAKNTAQQRAVWRIVTSKNLSVRQTEDLVKTFKEKNQNPNPNEPTSEEIYFSGLSEDLSRHFGARVKIKRQGKKGKVEIEFYNNEDLNRLIELLKSEPCEL
jgi:ParB family transcriptional regulator, chromosome partitioning protein